MEREALGGGFDLPAPESGQPHMVEPSPQPHPLARSKVPAHSRVGDARLLQRLQQQAGNRAVTALLQEARGPASDGARRDCEDKAVPTTSPVGSRIATVSSPEGQPAQQGRHPDGLAVQRLMNTKQWQKRRPKRWKKAAHLKPIDEVMEAYDKVRKKGGPSQKQQLLYDLLAAVDQWKKAPPGDAAPDELGVVDSLRAEVEKEIRDLVLTFSAKPPEERLKEYGVGLARIVPASVKREPDLGRRAQQIFDNYMTEFRGKVTYTLKTVPNISIFVKADLVACATISNGLRDALRYGGIDDAATVQIKAEKFITNPIVPGKFIDSSAEGNVRRPGGTFADEKRFFFTMHWIVSAPSAKVHFDPTSGIPVSANADEIVDATLSGFKGGGLGTKGASYTSDSHVLKTLDEGTRHGGGYELSDKTP